MTASTVKGHPLSEAQKKHRRPNGEFGEFAHDEPTQVTVDTGDAGNNTILEPLQTVYSDIKDRDERTRQMFEDLRSATMRMVEEGKLAEFLDRMVSSPQSRFSFRNQILTDIQVGRLRAEKSPEELEGIPPVPMVMTYKQWAARGRQVKAGENAVWVLAPSTKWITEDDPDHPGEKRKRKIVVGFRPQAEFDACQTEGDPIAWRDPIATLPDSDDDEVVARARFMGRKLKEQVEQRSYIYVERPLSSSPVLDPEGLLGATSPGQGTVEIDSRLSPQAKASVLAHELAHIDLGHVNDYEEYRKHRDIQETEAEMTAYLTSRHLGLPAHDSEAFSAGYIMAWSKGDPEMMEKAFGRASKAALALVDAVQPTPPTDDAAMAA